jgi:response regulator RpfG family c-di-GMP phosphodiesterase
VDTKSAVILVEEDNDDVILITDIFKDLDIQHELRPFTTIEEAFVYIKGNTEKPFLVICNNNYRNGNQQRLQTQLDLFPQNKLKTIPIVFYSTTADENIVTDAFEKLHIHGFFKKASNYEQMKNDVKLIIDYWERSKHPILK